MGDSLDGVVVMSDDRPLLPNPKVDTASGLGLDRIARSLGDDGGHRHK
jgi:hypothetical protein